MTRDAPSPRIGPAELRRHAGHLTPPEPHDDAELVTLVDLLAGARPRLETVVLGHSRDDASRHAAHAFAEAWQARGGVILTQVDWPEEAASWLRPARRLTALTPDAWVIAAAVPGFAQLARRLARSTDFDPSRAVAFASLADPRLPALAGPGTLDGLRGATADGGVWEVRGGWVTTHRHPVSSAAIRRPAPA